MSTLQITTKNTCLAESQDLMCTYCEECFCLADEECPVSSNRQHAWLVTRDQAPSLDIIQSHGAKIAKADAVSVSQEAYESVQCGKKFARQGDLYFTKLAVVPSDARPWTLPHGQLVPGNTQGSRHAVDLVRVRLYTLAHPTALDGPVIEAPDGVVISHPEHGDHHYLFPCVIQVTYQRSFADELRRVAD